jgi:hypothetical protein
VTATPSTPQKSSIREIFAKYRIDSNTRDRRSSPFGQWLVGHARCYKQQSSNQLATNFLCPPEIERRVFLRIELGIDSIQRGKGGNRIPDESEHGKTGKMRAGWHTKDVIAEDRSFAQKSYLSLSFLRNHHRRRSVINVQKVARLAIFYLAGQHRR